MFIDMDMGTLRITEAELARDIHAVLAKVQTGVEVIVEQDHRPVALILTPLPHGRLPSESIALAEARGTAAIPDEGFMKDVGEGMADRWRPWIGCAPSSAGKNALQREDRAAQPWPTRNNRF
jgi:antitoxin (DNA-binding transcriptional repressor) of toxin-antitoxin stability system